MKISALQEILHSCPWCGGKKSKKWGKPVRSFESYKCLSCSLIYTKNPLNGEGLKKFYSDYLSHIHQADQDEVNAREKMYQIEFSLISQHLNKNCQVLDVGCSGGYFLEKFKQEGHHCYGVEFGQEAAEEAQKKYTVWVGSFPDIDINKKFDLIIFRGVIEHVQHPRLYLDKALSLLNEEGIILITSTPNGSSLCAELFKEKWNQHWPEAHPFHFSPKHFDDYFTSKNFTKIAGHFPYLDTPYANPFDDINQVNRAISLHKNGENINFISPAFFESMMTLIYKKSKWPICHK